MRVAVVGHVEWVEFLRVPAVPQTGEIVHVSEAWAEPAGGGAVAAVQLCKLAGSVDFFTALGDDQIGLHAAEQLAALGVRLHVAWRSEPQRRAVTFIDGRGERTIVVIGDRIVPVAADPLPWQELPEMDGV